MELPHNPQRSLDPTRTTSVVLGLVLFGTEDTDNQLHGDIPDSYEHVKVFKTLDIADTDLCNALKDLKPSKADVQGDFLDGLVVSCDMIDRKLKKKKCSRNRNIFLVTNAASVVQGVDDVDQVTQSLREMECAVHVIGTDFGRGYC